MSKKNKQSKKNAIFSARTLVSGAINALVAAVVTVVVSLIVDALKPVDKRIQAQMDHLKLVVEKDTLIIDVAKRLKGNIDQETVERVKQDVIGYLAKSLEEYPTKEEFFREKHRYIDKEQGLIWESRMENGNMILLPVAPYTNNSEKVCK